MSKDDNKEIKKDKVKKRKRGQNAGRITVKVIAALMAACMVFAVAATCIFYIQYYI